MRLAEIAPIQMWHGSKRWDGQPEVQAPRKGRYEAGPGIYTTTSYFTAAEYAKGGGSTLLLSIRPGIRLAHTVDISLDHTIAFLNENKYRLRDKIIADLKRNSARTGKTTYPATVLINLIVNHEAGSGQSGILIAKFLRDQGVDAVLERTPARFSTQDWLVIVDPEIILRAEKIAAKDVPKELRDLPRPFGAAD